MTSFTFTSEDLERVNKDKKQDDKIFPEIANPRIARGLMKEDGKTPDWEKKVKEQFIKDATRTLPVILKEKDKTQVILDISNTGSDKERVTSLVQKQILSLNEKGLSPEQVNDFKLMSNQSNIAATITPLTEYLFKKKFLHDEHNLLYTQYPNSILAQLEIRTSPPDNQERLIYRTGSKMTFDKSSATCNYSATYNTSASYDIPSNDNILIIAEVDLGKLGETNYTPKVTCSIHAEGKNAEKILGQISADIPPSSNSKVKSSEEIKAQYQDIVVKTLQDTGYEKIFEEEVKNKIGVILSNNPNLESITPAELGALKEFKSTPKLFAEVLVDRISEINNITDHKEHAQAMKQLSDNAALFVDQPKGYMKVLINDTAKEMAKEGNINLPKQGIISKISHNIELMLAKINVKIHGKSPQLKEHRELITQARAQTQQKQNTGYSR